MKKQTLIYIAIAVVVLIVIYFLLNKNNTIMTFGLGGYGKGKLYRDKSICEAKSTDDVSCKWKNGFCNCVMGG